MTESKTSEAQKKASKAYYEKNKERALMNNRRTAAEHLWDAMQQKRI